MGHPSGATPLHQGSVLAAGPLRAGTWRPTALLAALLLAAACRTPASGPGATSASAAPRRGRVVLSIVGTSDLHGHVEQLPLFAGYLNNLRARRQGDGAVLLVDAGDMFQGTLESNLGEGDVVVEAYGALGYDAVAIGNHEFDFGPLGPAVKAERAGDDPRGALKARARQARFPFLAANLRRAQAGGLGPLLAWPNVRPSVMRTVAGVPVGIVGVTTRDTLTTTLVANVSDLAVEPLVTAIDREATALRAQGARVVIVAAHAGGKCSEFGDADDLSSCDGDQEIMQVARKLPPGAVDVIAAGHTHAAMAHRVNGIAVVQAHHAGRAFGRVDLVVDRGSGKVVAAHIQPPQPLCPAEGPAATSCTPGPYEGRPVRPDARLAAVIAPARARATALRQRQLGVTLTGQVTAVRDAECALGNLFADLMREARPDADVAMTNGGGLRADLPAGALTYGDLFQAMPFDNRFARIRLSGKALRQLVASNLRHGGGFLSWSGITVDARCAQGQVDVILRRNGRPVADDEQLTLLTSDYLASGGASELVDLALPPDAVRIEDGPTIRDEMARVLSERGDSIYPAALFDATRPRVRLTGARPLLCR
jgi:5'-nucleotidase